jgi:hypothetical protein
VSVDASAPAREESESQTTDYESMLESLDVAIAEAQRKIESGRVYDESKEKTRQGWIRALAYTINVRRQVANDRDLEELAEQVEQLKENNQSP